MRTGTHNHPKPTRSLLTILLLLIASNLTAQEADQQEDSDDGGMIEEVIVTASKRGASSAQDLAGAITAFNGDKMDRLNAVDFDEFIVQVPSTNFIDNGGPGRGHEVASIRGLSPVADNTDGVVAQYLDGSPRFGSNYRMFDIGSIAVLRGPQGTLWGSQALGGTIIYESRRPETDASSAMVETDIYWSEDDGGASNRTTGYFNLPIIEDTLAIRFAGQYINESGYVDNITTGDKNINDVKETSYRISALYTPTDEFALTLIYQGSDLSADAPSYFDVDLPGRIASAAKSDLPADQDYNLATIMIDWELGFANFNYTGSFFDMDNIYYDITDAEFGVPGWFADHIFSLEQDSTTHEFRLVSKGDSSFNWIVGVYLDDLDATSLETSIDIGDPQDPDGAPIFGPGFEYFVIGGPEDRKEKAVFGEISYDFNDRWQVLLGARYFDWEVNNQQEFTFFGSNFQQETGKVGDTDSFYKVQVNFRPTDDILIYGTRSEGFRFGGFNPFVGPALGIPEEFIKFLPDTLINYELGAKMVFMDRKMVLNTAIYHMNWENIQTVVFNESDTFAFTTNGPDLDAQGFEIELATQDLMIQGLYLSAIYSYMDNEFQNDAVVFPGTTPLISKGDSLRRTPKNSWAFDVGYEFTLGSTTDAFVRANYWHKDKTTTESFNSGDGIVPIPAQDVFNLSAGIYLNSWMFKMYLNNASDERPFLNVLPSLSDPAQAASASSIRPRTFGLIARYQFGRG